MIFVQKSILVKQAFFCKFVAASFCLQLTLNVTENGFQGCNLFQITWFQLMLYLALIRVLENDLKMQMQFHLYKVLPPRLKNFKELLAN